MSLDEDEDATTMVDEIQDHERYSLAFSKARSRVGEATLSYA